MTTLELVELVKERYTIEEFIQEFGLDFEDFEDSLFDIVEENYDRILKNLEL